MRAGLRALKIAEAAKRKSFQRIDDQTTIRRTHRRTRAIASTREAGATAMQTNDLHPPRTGLNADPILYGVAAGLADLFPPVAPSISAHPEHDGEAEHGEPDDSAAD